MRIFAFFLAGAGLRDSRVRFAWQALYVVTPASVHESVWSGVLSRFGPFRGARVMHHGCRVASCHVLSPRVSRHVMRHVNSCHGEGWQAYDPRTLRGVKAEPPKTRRNMNRWRVAKQLAGAKGALRFFAFRCPKGFIF